MGKKILAGLLSLAMLSSAASILVFAENDDAEIAEATKNMGAEEISATDETNLSNDTIDYDAAGDNADSDSEGVVDETEWTNEPELTLMTTGDTVTYPMEQDDTYSFENIDIVARDVAGLDEYVDYVVYYKDGSIKEYNWSQRPGTISVPTGGKIIITSISDSVAPVVADEYFIVQEEADPAFNKVEAKLYETYTYTNTSNVSYDLLSNGYSYSNRYYDYVIYNTEGNVTDYACRTSSSSLEIPADYSIKVTVTNNPVTFNGIYEKFSLVKNNEPVMKKIIASAGETYIYTNNSTTSYDLLSNGYSYSNRYYDYVIYDTEGNVTNYACETSSSSLEIPAGYSVKVTVTNNPVTFNGIYEKFSLVKNNEPVMKKIIASAGETCIYTNNSTISYNLLSNGYSYSNRYYDYVIYDVDGNISNYVRETSSNSIEIPAGYSIKVTVTNNPVTFNGLYGKFGLQKNDKPVMKKVIVSAGETYIYTNNSTASYNLLSNGYSYSNRYYDYVTYYSNNTVKETVSGSSASSVEIPAGGKIKLTVSNNPVTFSGLDEVFDIDNTSAEMPSYKITNTDTIESVMSLKSGYSYDYAVYDAEGTLIEYDVSSTSKVTIPKGGYTITSVCSSVTDPFDENNKLLIESRANPVYRTTYLNAEETYKYTNTSSRDLLVYKNGLSCDYVIHNADGSISSYEQNATDYSFSVPAGGDICITAHVYLNIKGLFEYFTAEKLSEPVFNIIPYALDETYCFTNNSVKDMDLNIIRCVYDYVVYNADNTVANIDMNSTSNSISIPSGSTCVITPQTSNIIVYALNEAFTSSARSYPVLMRMPVYYGEVITMNNLSDENRTIYSSVENYIDYATYDAGNNVQDEKELTTVSSIEVPANGRVEITARASNDLFAGLYEFFAEEDFGVTVTGVRLSSETLTIAPNQQTALRATVLPTNATNKTVIWSSSDTNVAVVAQTGKITAKSVGTAAITATTADSGYTAVCVVTVIDNDAVVTPTPGTNPTPTEYPYEIEQLTLKDENGNTFNSIPQGFGFIVDISFKKVTARNNNDYIFIAAYGENNELISIDYIQSNFVEDQTYNVGFYMQPQGQTIETIKAFIWSSFGSMEPLAETKEL